MAFEYLAPYATFESVTDMDKSVEDHMRVHRLDLTTSERAIVFMIAGRSLMYPGASHLKAETIAEKTKTSRSTVMRGIKKLIALEVIEKVAQTKLNGIKGASIYKILPFNDTSSMTQRMTVVEASNDVGLNEVSEDLSIKSFNLLKTSTTNIISNSITELENLALQAEKKKAYMNEYQQMLFDFLHALPMHDTLKDELYKIVLSTDLNDAQAFHKAKNVFVNILMDINNGTLTVSNTLRSVFKGAYDNAMTRESVMPSTTVPVEDEPVMKRVAFYDWLNEREDNRQPSEVGQLNIQNWLEW